MPASPASPVSPAAPASPPAPCSQSTAAPRVERDAFLPGLVVHALQRTAVPHGMRFRFVATAERLRQIATVAEHEWAYCSALEFHVGMALGSASLTLDVTGPEGTERFLAELLDEPLAA
jgi:hypothetical protein